MQSTSDDQLGHQCWDYMADWKIEFNGQVTQNLLLLYLIFVKCYSYFLVAQLAVTSILEKVARHVNAVIYKALLHNTGDRLQEERSY